MPVPYDPTQSVAPTTQPPNDYLSVRASPTDFGAQIGEATQQAGKEITNVGNTSIGVLTQLAGMQNETAIADAESKYNAGLGELDGQFKSLRGQAAVNAHAEYANKVLKLRQDIASSLGSPAIQRGFNVAAARTEGFTLRDYGNYVGTQIKQADTEATSALQNQAIDRASNFSVATDDRELYTAIGTVKDTASHLAENQGWDLKSDEGKAVLGRYLDEAKDKVFTNAIKAVADDPVNGSVTKAVE